MKIYIMTDLECVAGIKTLPEYCLSGPVNKYGRPEGGKYYEHACKLATLEVNAAIEGLLEGGAKEIFVCDGHGSGGLDISLMHPAATVLCGRNQKEPCGFDSSFDAAMMLGQHSKANTVGGHLAHSGSFSREDWQLNGVSVGEIELFMAKASWFDVPVVMISGDVAACQEAKELVPSIETVAVIEGQNRGSTAGMTTNKAMDLNISAIHFPPEKARDMIREGARRCLTKVAGIEKYSLADPPFEMIRITRNDPDTPSRRAINISDDFISLLGQGISYE